MKLFQPFNGHNQEGYTLFEMINKLDKTNLSFAQLMEAIVWEAENNYRSECEHISGELCKVSIILMNLINVFATF